ncbi:MAG: DUF2933 domain-containing protein [Firmicutes bacterium]|nr:DUF2933 domain-containing protein [Bacillota bacterium]
MKTLSKAALVLAGIAAVVWLARAGSLRAVAPWAVFLACPLMHLGMMAFMGRGCHHDREGHEHARGQEPRPGNEPERARAGEV